MSTRSCADRSGWDRRSSVGPVQTRGATPVEIVELVVGDEPAAWRAVGFSVGEGGACRVGGVRLRLAGRAGGPGITGWTLTAGDGDGDGRVDGVPTAVAPADDGEAPGDEHPNGVRSIDHLVVLTDDLDRTTGALAARDVMPRRDRDAGRGRRQRFFRLGEVILELVGPVDPRGDGPARLWGLAFTVEDIDATARSLAGLVGAPKDAVQPGRRIVTLHAGDGVSVPVAFMSAPPGGMSGPHR